MLLMYQVLTERLTQLRAEAEDLLTEAPAPWRLKWDGQELHLLDSDGSLVSDWSFGIATWEPDASLDRLNTNTKIQQHMSTWHPGMALAVILAAEKVLQEHRPEAVRRISGVVYCDGEHRVPTVWSDCPEVLRVASWAMSGEPAWRS